MIIWPALMAGVILWAAGSSGAQVPSRFSFPHFDKLAHFLVYGLIATLIFRVLADLPRQTTALFLAVLATSLLGAVDELRQSFNPHRFYETADWVADTVGAITAVLVYRFWPWYRNLLEFPLIPLPSSTHGKRKPESGPANRRIAGGHRPA